MEILTRFNYEKKWLKTTKKEALDIIEKEMPQTDPDGTLLYILNEIKKGKTITLGDCKFKVD